MSLFAYFVASYFVIRIFQRLYYVAKGHKFYFFKFNPKDELKKTLEDNKISFREKSTYSKDRVKLKYTIIGSGPKIVYLGSLKSKLLFLNLTLSFL